MTGSHFFVRFAQRLLSEWGLIRAMFGTRLNACVQWIRTHLLRYIIHYDLPKSMEGI